MLSGFYCKPKNDQANGNEGTAPPNPTQRGPWLGGNEATPWTVLSSLSRHLPHGCSWFGVVPTVPPGPSFPWGSRDFIAYPFTGRDARAGDGAPGARAVCFFTFVGWTIFKSVPLTFVRFDEIYPAKPASYC